MCDKAEGDHGKRLYIDKPMLREWREHFARMMREQGIAANATPRVVRGRNKGKRHEGIFRARRRGDSYAFREKVMAMATELNRNGRFGEPANTKLVETRKVVVACWMQIAETLDRQGEVALAGDVRHFAKRLPLVRTDAERIAAQFIRHLTESKHPHPSREQAGPAAPTR
jgi:hypothetical protein